MTPGALTRLVIRRDIGHGFIEDPNGQFVRYAEAQHVITQQAQELEQAKGNYGIQKAAADDYEQQLTASQARCREMEERKDAAYLERNHLVAALARCFPSGIRKTAIEGWSDDWHGCVYIDLPAGQISYHYHDAQADLFFGLPAYDKPYDGHTKEQVHDRLQSAQLQATLAAREARIRELEDQMNAKRYVTNEAL